VAYHSRGVLMQALWQAQWCRLAQVSRPVFFSAAAAHGCDLALAEPRVPL